MFKRIVLFLATNLAVLALLSIVMAVLQNVFGVTLGNNGALLVMATVFGFGGSFISLMMSKWMAKRSTGAHVIEQPANEAEQWLVTTVRRQAEAAGIKMPEVAIYDAPEINAFATGPSRNNSLVAVSTGLLRAMNRDEAEAVLAHEVSHVANGDMVTMALIQGVLNTFVIVLARVVGCEVLGVFQRQQVKEIQLLSVYQGQDSDQLQQTLKNLGMPSSKAAFLQRFPDAFDALGKLIYYGDQIEVSALYSETGESQLENITISFM